METLLSCLYFTLNVTHMTIALQLASILIVGIPVLLLVLYYIAIHTPYTIKEWFKAMRTLTLEERDSWFVVNTPKYVWMPTIFVSSFCSTVWTVVIWFAVTHCLIYFCFIPIARIFL